MRILPEVTSTEDLTTEILNLFFERIQTRERKGKSNSIKIGVKSSTIKTQWTKLNVFFKWLNENDHLDRNPLKGIKPPRVSYDDFKRLEDHEINKIYSAIVRCSSNLFLLRRDTMMVSLLIYLGVRKGEFISFQIKDIDLYKREITIRGETSKSKKSRVLKMHPTLVMHIKDYLNELNSRGIKTEQLIVSNRGDSGLSRDGLKHWTESIIKKSGVKFHLHQFRHTFACKLDEARVPSFNIQKMMGHSSIVMTMKYVRSLKTENMGEDIDKISF